MAVVIPEAAEAVAGGASAAEGAEGAAASSATSKTRSSSGDWGRTAQGLYQRLPSGGQQGGTGTAIRLIWAAAAGLLALEVLSLATNRYWSWSLKGGLDSLRQAGQYIGLYPGQQLQVPGQPASTTTYYAGLGQQTIVTNQGTPPAQRGRSAGTQQVGP